MKTLRNLIVTATLLLSYQNHSLAQNKKDLLDDRPIFHFGIGTGIDYGGIGFKAEGAPIPYVGIFGGIGYNFKGLGANGGLSFKALPFARACPTVQVAYGYNAVIVIKGASEYDKTYYGLSIGAGLDLNVGSNYNKLFFGIYYPFRSDEYHDDLKELKANQYIKFENEPLPVTLTIGFNIAV